MHQQIYEEIIKDLRLQNLHPFHLTVLEECCENAVLHSHDISNSLAVKQDAQVAFISVVPIIQQTMQAAFQNTDTITFTYRNKQFLLQKNIILLTQFLQHMVKMAMDGCIELEGIDETHVSMSGISNFASAKSGFQQTNFQ